MKTLLLLLFTPLAFANTASVPLHLEVARAHYKAERLKCQKLPAKEVSPCLKALDKEYNRIVADIKQNERAKP